MSVPIETRQADVLQRVVCGRNMSTDQLFSNGGQANSFDQLRDQLKEKDEEVLYLYDNSTSPECNDFMKGLEENRDRSDQWDIDSCLLEKVCLFSLYIPCPMPCRISGCLCLSAVVYVKDLMSYQNVLWKQVLTISHQHESY